MFKDIKILCNKEVTFNGDPEIANDIKLNGKIIINNKIKYKKLILILY